MPNAVRRLMLIREPLADCVVADVIERLSALGVVVGHRVDDCADVAYIVIDTAASDYAITGAAVGWRIWQR